MLVISVEYRHLRILGMRVPLRRRHLQELHEHCCSGVQGWLRLGISSRGAIQVENCIDSDARLGIRAQSPESMEAIVIVDALIQSIAVWLSWIVCLFISEKGARLLS